jgi:hypothetical protein
VYLYQVAWLEDDVLQGSLLYFGVEYGLPFGGVVHSGHVSIEVLLFDERKVNIYFLHGWGLDFLGGVCLACVYNPTE